MKLWDIIKTVGSAAIQVALPGVGSGIVAAVNAFLPDDNKLPSGATGDDINNAVSRLSPDQQASLMEKEFDVSITQIKESNSTVRAMLESDVKNPQSTRPYIAKGAFHVIAFSIIATMSSWVYAVFMKDEELISNIMDGWQFILAVIGPLVTLYGLTLVF